MNAPVVCKHARPEYQLGVSMIEILVALLIVSIGVLGYAGLQLRALNSTEDAHYRTQATALAQDVIERMAANPRGQNGYTTGSDWPLETPTSGMPNTWGTCLGANDCTPAQMAVSDIEQARWFAAQMLPGGRVRAQQCAGAQGVCVTVAWGNASPADCNPLRDQCVRLEAIIWAAP